MSKALYAVKTPLFIVLAVVLLAAGWYFQNNQSASAASIIRVAGSGNNVGACGKEDSTPCRTIQYAVKKAVSGDTILVAAGTYTYDSSNPCNIGTGNVGVVCFADKNLTILGGYTTSNWTTPDPTTNLTVIDGENAHRGVIIVAFNNQVNFQMEGFTIRNGFVQGSNDANSFYADAKGAGLWSQSASITLRDMIFENNKAVGGFNSSANIGGAADGAGLAITAPENQPTTNLIERITFTNNQAIGGDGGTRGGFALGGAMFVYSANLTGNDITVAGNTAQAGSTTQVGTYNSTNADALGGGISVQEGSTVTFNNLVLTGNQAVGGNAGSFSGAMGGGSFGGAMHIERSTINLTEGHFEDNQSVGGDGYTGGFAFSGALELIDSNGTFNRVIVIKNTATAGSSNGGVDAGAPSGGGSYITTTTGPGKEVTFNNCIYAGNEMIKGTGKSPGGGGGGMVVQGVTVNLNHCTFADNKMADLNNGVAILTQIAGDKTTEAVLNLNYSIVANNGDFSRQVAIFVTKGSTANLNKVLFSNNPNHTNDKLAGYLEQGVINGLSTCVDLDDPTKIPVGFISPGSPDYDYHLMSTSPAIDIADGSTLTEDIDGDPRPYGAGRDIGADEYTPPALTASPDTVFVLAAGSTPVLRQVLVGSSTGDIVDWNVATSESWLYLDAGGTLKTANGNTGDTLTLYFDPSVVANGTYTETLSLTSTTADPTSIDVTLVKVDQVYSIFLPVITQ